MQTAVRVSANAQVDQKKAFEDSERRWATQVREGLIKSVASDEAKKLLADGWTLLDVRPPNETEAAVKGAVTVPIFVVDDDMSPAGLLKQASAFGMGGWWLGGRHMKPNPDFLRAATAALPPDSKVLVACQKGLRSLMASEQLVKQGYSQVAWLSGGFEASPKGSWETTTGQDVRMAGIGGVSALLGMTEVQLDGSSKLGGFERVLKAVAVFIAIDLVVFGPQLYQEFFGAK